MSDGSNKDPQRALVFATGDIIVDEPDPYSFFEPSRELLSSGDFVIGQIEVPHTDRGEANSTDIPAPPAAPEILRYNTFRSAIQLFISRSVFNP